MWISIVYAVCMLLAFLGFDRDYYWPIYPGYFWINTGGLFLFGLWWIHSIRTKQLIFPKILLGFLAFLGWSSLSTLWAQHTWMAYDGLWKYASFLFLTLGLCYILQKYSMLRNYFWPLNLGVLAISAFFYLIQMQQENWNLPGRFSFPFGNPTVAGTVLGFGCAIAAGLGIAKFKQKQWAYASFYTCLAALFGCVLFLAKAKAAMIATIAALLYLFIRTYPRIGLAFLFLMVLGCSISYEAWMSSIAPSLEIRLWIWQDTWKMILDNPWRCCVGFGPGNFIACFPKFQSPSFFAAFYSAEIVESPHNICLEVWSEFGLIG